MTLYVEGGGEANATLKTTCRQSFQEFFRRAGLDGRMPKVIACGTRSKAFKRFRGALVEGEDAMLLVDSEGPVPKEIFSPWSFLYDSVNDRWKRPTHAKDEHCHLMVQCMECWFLADREMLEHFFGEGFQTNHLPRNGDIESIANAKNSLRRASEKSRKGKYDEGLHSFALLALVDPEKVMNNSPWAKRFIETLRSTGNGASHL